MTLAREAPLIDALIEARHASGLSQAEVAHRMRALGASWHPATIARVETGRQPLRMGEALALAEVYGVDLADLIQQASAPSLRDRLQDATDPQRVDGLLDEAGRALDGVRGLRDEVQALEAAWEPEEPGMPAAREMDAAHRLAHALDAVLDLQGDLDQRLRGARRVMQENYFDPTMEEISDGTD